MDNWAEANVFIFNFNEENSKNVELLEKTFTKFNCIVKSYEKLTKAQILKAAKEISMKVFTLFKYIVIIVLDNRNKSEDVISSSDGFNVKLHSEFLTTILENRTLCNKKLLFLLQINRNYVSDEDEENFIAMPMPENSKPIYSSTKVYLHAVETSQTLILKENELFIKTFCDCFSKYGNTLGIDRIHIKVNEHLKMCGYKRTPTMEKHFQTEDRIFGKALTEEEIKDFYPESYTRFFKGNFL